MSSCTISERKLSNCSRKDESWEDSCCHTRCASVLEGGGEGGGGGRREEGREVETRDENGGKGKGGREKGERWGKREILYI